MKNLRGIFAISVPIVSGLLFGFFWYFGRKKTKPKSIEPQAQSSEEQSRAKPSNNVHIPQCSSPATNRKRKACQISREAKHEEGEQNDSVDEEMEGTEEKMPLIESEEKPLTKSAEVPFLESAEILCVKSTAKVDKQQESENGEEKNNSDLKESEVTEESIVIEKIVPISHSPSGNQRETTPSSDFMDLGKDSGLSEKSISHSDCERTIPINETILECDKSVILNDAFITTGISEQSIVSEDKPGKVDDLSLSTSRIEEPLLESTMIDNLNSLPQNGKNQAIPISDVSSEVNDISARIESSMSLTAENYSLSLPDSKPASVEQTTKNQQKTESSKNTPTKILSRNTNKTDAKNISEVKSQKSDTVDHKLSYKTKDSQKKSPERTFAERQKTKNSSPDLQSRKARTSSSSDHTSENAMDRDLRDSSSESSNDSGKGRSLAGTLSPGAGNSTPTGSASPSQLTYHFNFPSFECGRLIGRNGRNINIIKEKSGATISLTANPFTTEYQLCVVEGNQKQIDIALDCISRKFPEVDMTPIALPNKDPSLPQAPVLMPEIMQVMPEITQIPSVVLLGMLNLPEGVSVDVVVSSIVDTGHLFLQQPTHPSFPSLERLNQFMNVCYHQNGVVPQLPRPIEIGVICAAPLMDTWYRAQITAVYDDTDECDIKYVDYGGFSRTNGSSLRQIRSDFMTLPFQACECYLGNVTPLQDEEYFSGESAAVLEELTQGKMLQAQVVGRSDDGVPYVHIYQISGEKVVFVNRELVNRGLARWIEVLS